MHQVRVATHSDLTEHAKVAGNPRHTCVYKKQISYFDKNHALLTVNMTVYQLGVDDVCIIIIISIIKARNCIIADRFVNDFWLAVSTKRLLVMSTKRYHMIAYLGCQLLAKVWVKHV